MSIGYKLLERCIKAVDLKKMYSMPPEELMKMLQTKFRDTDLPESVYKQCRVSRTVLDGRPVFRIENKDKRNKRNAKTILFIHGGAGMMCPTPVHYRFAVRLVKRTGAVLYMPFYPLGPEASINDSMKWLDKAYSMILKESKDSDITVIGDSAGAALSIALCRRNTSKPAGLILISPAVGIEKAGAQMKELEKYDVMLSAATLEITKKYWLKDADPATADFNTCSRKYENFPPVLLFYGTYEIFYAHIHELIDTIRSSGVEITACKGEKLCHDWALIGIVPEGRKALDKMCRFIVDSKSRVI